MLPPAMRLPAIQIDIAGTAGGFRELQAGTAAALIQSKPRFQAVRARSGRVRRQPWVRPDAGAFARRLHRR